MSAPIRDNALREQGEVGSCDSKFKSDFTPDKPKRQGKSATILSILKSGQSLNRFEAERHGDHALNSTVSELRGKGYKLESIWEEVPTRFGKSVRVKRYSYAGAADNGAA